VPVSEPGEDDAIGDLIESSGGAYSGDEFRISASDLPAMLNSAIAHGASARKWTAWNQDCPVEADCFVEIRQRNGVTDKGLACDFVWGRIKSQPTHEIVAYRVTAGNGDEGGV
jgi:hypothetical protein